MTVDVAPLAIEIMTMASDLIETERARRADDLAVKVFQGAMDLDEAARQLAAAEMSGWAD
jgi:hypothetical protein